MRYQLRSQKPATADSFRETVSFASPKRDHNALLDPAGEDEKALDEKSGKKSKKAKVNGTTREPLAESVRLSTQSTMLDSTGSRMDPCWRCKMLGKRCERRPSSDTCRECRDTFNGEGRGWDIECDLGNLANRLDDVFPALPGLGTGEWYIPATDGINLKINMEYTDPNMKICDVPVSSASSATLYTFLDQFQDINNRWINQYESVTVDIINQCASIQKKILLKVCQFSSALSEENLLIAHALRTLALSHNVDELQGNISLRTKEYFHENKMFLKPEQLPTIHDPSIEVSRCTKKKASSRKQQEIPRLSSMIQDLVRITQEVVVRAQPTDFPVVFCTLCLLRLLESNVGAIIPFIDPLDPDGKLLDIWEILCGMFDVATGGNHPLVDKWNANEYRSLVGRSSQANASFRAMNKIWVDGGYQEKGDDDHFVKRMERYVMGYDDEDLHGAR